MSGYYCIGGERHECPAGRYGSDAGLSASDQCGSCSAGYFCPAGSISAQANVCGEGKYCPAGSGSPQSPEAGLQLAGGGSTTRTHVEACASGHTCVNGSATACPAGRYGSDGLVCEECGSPTYYCPEGSGTRVTVSVGYYSVGGNSSQRTGQTTCLPGTYCTSGVALPCGSVAVWCPAAAAAPTTAQGGFYTVPAGVNASRRTGVAECEPGPCRAAPPTWNRVLTCSVGVCCRSLLREWPAPSLSSGQVRQHGGLEVV